MKTSENSGWLISVFVWCAALVLLCIRCFFSVETTDEVFYVSEALLVADGGVPYFDMWFQTPGYAVFLAPFLKLFIAATGSTAGIVLFARLLSVVLKFIICLLISSILAPLLGKTSSHLMGACLFSMLPGSTMVASYNSWYVLFIALGSTLLFYGYHSPHRTRPALFSAGCAFALAAYAYSSGILLCLFLIPLYVLVDLRRRKRSGLLCHWVMLGGAATAALVLFFSMMRGHYSPADLVTGLQSILTGPYTYAEPYTPMNKLPSLINNLLLGTLSIRLFVSGFLCGILFSAFVGSPRFSKMIGSRTPAVRLLFFYLVLGCMALLMSASFVLSWGQNFLAEFLFLYPLFFLPLLEAEKRRLAKELFLYIWLPVLASLLVAGALAFDGCASRGYMLTFGGVLSIPFCRWAWENCRKPVFKKPPFFADAAPALLALSVLTMLFYSNYSFVYRDVSIRQMDARVGEGIYRGLYTSAERAEDVVHLERLIRANTSAEDTVVFFGGWVTEGYLMTDARNISFSSLSPISVRDGPACVERLRRVLSLRGYSMPDKLVFFNTLEEPAVDFTEVDSAEYPLRSVLDNQYTISYEDASAGFGFRVYTKR